MPDIRFSDVSVVYGQRTILSSITTCLSERRIAVIGENGGGKSTLVRLINGLGDATAGTVTVDGINVATHASQVRQRVGFVFADADNQIVMPTVREDIAFSLRRFKLPRPEVTTRVDEAMERFNLTAHADASPHVLSGGQKQLLALAAVLVMKPDIIIADEPTTLLDLRNRNRIRQIFAELEQQLIVVTHDLDFITDFDRVLRIGDARIISDGPPANILHDYVADMSVAGEG